MAAVNMYRPRSVKLAGVKHEIYHPSLPTLRKMDMDNVTCKLSNEHARTTTPCTREMFSTARSTLEIPPTERLHCKVVLSRQTDTALRTYQPLSVPSYTESWNAALELLNRVSSTAPTHAKSDTLDGSRITGFSLRSKLPAITNAWQYSRPGGGGVEGSRTGYSPSTGRPLPANMYSRHRAVRRPTAMPWK